MVHTRFLAGSEDVAHLPRLHVVAMSYLQNFAVVRPRHAQHSDRAEYWPTSFARTMVATPDIAIRLAVADDSDPFTDLSAGEEGLWMRGSWVDGAWVSEDSHIHPSERKVAEGRILGYSVWSRIWPTNEDALKAAKARGINVWSQDSLRKKIERYLLNLEYKYWTAATPDAAEDPTVIAEMPARAARFRRRAQPVIEGLSKTTGYMYLSNLAIDPSFQRRGLGERLIRWGKEQARAEGIPILLRSSEQGLGLYKKLGFESLGYDPSEEQEEDVTMIFWPENVARVKLAKAESGQERATQGQ